MVNVNKSPFQHASAEPWWPNRSWTLLLVTNFFLLRARRIAQCSVELLGALTLTATTPESPPPQLLRHQPRVPAVGLEERPFLSLPTDAL